MTNIISRPPPITRTIGLAILFFWGTASYAEWSLEPQDSSLHFISVKATNIAEVHSFEKIRATINGKGAVKLEIDLASVNTLIPIRDQRMRDYLFEVVAFPKATVYAQILIDDLEKLPSGSSRKTQISANLEFKELKSDLLAEVIVSRLNDKTVMVQSDTPLILSAANLQVENNLERLREIAGLPTISSAIPVTFRLTFSKD